MLGGGATCLDLAACLTSCLHYFILWHSREIWSMSGSGKELSLEELSSMQEQEYEIRFFNLFNSIRWSPSILTSLKSWYSLCEMIDNPISHGAFESAKVHKSSPIDLNLGSCGVFEITWYVK